MNERAAALAEKLHGEGERTLGFFRALPAEGWARPCHGEAGGWTVAHVLEHLVLSETTLRGLFEAIASGTGSGAPEGFDVDAFNAHHAGELVALGTPALLARFAQCRAETSAFARTLSDAQLDRSGRHPALGISTLESMLRLIPLHNTMHIKDVKKAIA